jgi:hypothetical protein
MEGGLRVEWQWQVRDNAQYPMHIAAAGKSPRKFGRTFTKLQRSMPGARIEVKPDGSIRQQPVGEFVSASPRPKQRFSAESLQNGSALPHATERRQGERDSSSQGATCSTIARWQTERKFSIRPAETRVGVIGCHRRCAP